MSDEYKIGAEITLENKFSREVDKVLASNKMMQQQLEKTIQKVSQLNKKPIEVKVNTTAFSRAMGRIETEARRTTGVIQKLFGGLSKLNPFSSIQGIVGMAGGGYAATKGFQATVGRAMNFEAQQVAINAMIGDKKKGDAYIQSLQQQAIASPILNSTDMMNNSVGFLSKTQDSKQLEKIWNLAERMLAGNPTKSVDDAAIALQELFSGDNVSIKERFNINDKALNDIKKMNLDDQLAAMDKLLDKYKMTNKLVKETGQTGKAMWSQFGEAMEVAMTKIGTPVLNKTVKPFLNKLNNLLNDEVKVNKFVNLGSSILTSIGDAFDWAVSGVSGIVSSFASKLTEDPEWDNMTFGEKVRAALDLMKTEFDSWWDSSGSAMVRDKLTQAMGLVIQVLQENTPAIVTTAIDIGTKIGTALADSIITAITSSPIAATIAGALAGARVGGLPGAVVGGLGAGAMTATSTKGFTGKQSKQSYTIERRFGLFPVVKKTTSKKAFGQARIARDDTPIMAHEGERILTKQQAQQMDKGGSGINLNFGTVNINNGMDYQTFVSQLTKDIRKAKFNAGGAWA